MDGRFEKTHGMSYSREYKSYHAMKQRCTNPDDPSWDHYGGKGVTVCDSWLESFENFYADMGIRPAEQTLDRIDPSGNYEPGNCRWATDLEQQNNRMNNVPVTVAGVTYASIAVCCRDHDVPTSTFHNRIKRGWSDERAATESAANNSGQEIVVAGVSYPTIADLLSAYSVHKATFYRRLKSKSIEQALGIK